MKPEDQLEAIGDLPLVQKPKRGEFPTGVGRKQADLRPRKARQQGATERITAELSPRGELLSWCCDPLPISGN